MDRKKALCMFAIIETLVNFIIITLFLMGRLSLTGFSIALAVILLISASIVLLIIRKTE